MKSDPKQCRGVEVRGGDPAWNWHGALYGLLALALAGSAVRGWSACVSERGNDLSIYL
jgi:hypothetical protein